MAKRINIMQVSFGMGIGGMEKVITDLCHYADRDRYNMMICCTNLKGALGERLEAEGYSVFVCSQKHHLKKYMRFWEVARILRGNMVDIVHSHSTACVDAIFGGVFAGTPIRIHTDHIKHYPFNWRYMFSEKIASYFADQFVAVSMDTKNELVKWEHISPDKISVIYNGMSFSDDVGDFALGKIYKEYGLKENEKIVGSVGRLEYQKGYNLLIDAAPIVLSKVPQARFVIVGGGSKERELREQIERLGLKSKVLLTGWRLDASLILKTFDVFVMTSNFEGMPIVLLEAMALGKPIITTTVGGVPEMVGDQENGLWLRERDPSKLATLIIEVLSNDEKRKDMGQKGLVKYRRYYRAERMAQTYMDLYEKYLFDKRIG